MTVDRDSMPYAGEKTDDEPQHVVSFGHGWVKYLLGLVELLEEPNHWQETVDMDEVTQQMHDLIVRIMEGIDVSQQYTGPHVAPYFVLHGSVVATTIAVDGASIAGGYVYQLVPVDGGDVVEVWTYLPAGDYSVALWCAKNINCGILDLMFDQGNGGEELGSIDTYATTFTKNYVLLRDMTITEPGIVRVYARVDGKNASSTSYYGIIHALVVEIAL